MQPTNVLAARCDLLSASVAAHLWSTVERGDIVLAVTNPPTLPYVAAAIARQKGAQFVLLVHDVYPEVLVATGIARSGSAMVRGVARSAAWLYCASSRVVVLGRDMAHLVVHRMNDDAHPIDTGRNVRIIPNWADTDEIGPDHAGAAAVRRQLGLEDRFVVQFVGNMGRTHGVDSLLNAAHRMRDDPDVHFLFVGWGGRQQAIERSIRDEHLPNASVHPPCDRDQLSAWLNVGDVATIAFVPGMAGVSVPSRMYNVMAAGRPILAVADGGSELALVVGEEQCGVVTASDGRQCAPGSMHEVQLCGGGARMAPADPRADR